MAEAVRDTICGEFAVRFGSTDLWRIDGFTQIAIRIFGELARPAGRRGPTSQCGPPTEDQIRAVTDAPRAVLDTAALRDIFATWRGIGGDADESE